MPVEEKYKKFINHEGTVGLLDLSYIKIPIKQIKNRWRLLKNT